MNSTCLVAARLRYARKPAKNRLCKLFLTYLFLLPFTTLLGQGNCVPAGTSFGQCGDFFDCNLAIVSSRGNPFSTSCISTDLILQAYEPNNSFSCNGLENTWYYTWYDPSGTPILCGQGETVLENVTTPGLYTCEVLCSSSATTRVSATINLVESSTFATNPNPQPSVFWGFDQGGNNIVTGIDGSVSAKQVVPGTNGSPFVARFDFAHKALVSTNPNVFVDYPQGSIAQPCACSNSDVMSTTAMSVEFWVKFDKFKLNGDKMDVLTTGQCGPLWSLRIGPDELEFSGLNINKSIRLDGIGRKSIQYYMDNEWHHFALTLEGVEGALMLYVDGQSPPDFQAHFEPISPSSPYEIGCHYLEFDIDGALDELAIYGFDALTPQAVVQHFDDRAAFTQTTDANGNGVYGNPGTPYPSPCNIPYPEQFYSNFNAFDFPKGYDQVDIPPFTSQIATARTQVANAPNPRYLPDHNLKRIFPWLHKELYRTYGGEDLPPNDPTYEASAQLMEEFIDHWNHFIVLPEKDYQKNRFHLDLANERPDVSLGVITEWKNSNASNVNDVFPHEAMIERKDLSYNHYLDCPSYDNVFDPTAPRHFLSIDGLYWYEHIAKQYLKHLDRPIDEISEDGEVQPNIANQPCFDEFRALNKTSDTYIDHKTWVQANNPPHPAQAYYYADFKTEWRQHYLDAMFQNDPRLARTKATWYSVDGSGGHFLVNQYPAWNTIRDILPTDPNNGYHYSTLDLYSSSPINWWKGTGVSHGLEYLYRSRKVELAKNDFLCSPFVNPGYRAHSTTWIRPGQWLGFLKLASVYGAETFYPGYFETGKAPRIWIWQLMMPSYAQAITSRYEEILRQGDVLHDGSEYQFNIPHINCDPTFSAGVRKYSSNATGQHQNQYVIASSRQPFTNYVDPLLPNDGTFRYTVDDFDGLGQLDFHTRKQGSVYIYQQDPSLEPVFFQLDSWHEVSHPDFWTKDFEFEAEVYDDLNLNGNQGTGNHMTRITRIISGGNETVPIHMGANDFTDYVTYLGFPDANNNNQSNFLPFDDPQLEYQFRVNSDDPNETFSYNLHIRARATDWSNTNSSLYYELYLPATDQVIENGNMGCISSGAWTWYNQGTCGLVQFTDLSQGQYILRITPGDNSLELDQIVLDETSSLRTWGTSVFCTDVPDLDLNFIPEVGCDGSVTFVNHSFIPQACHTATPYRWDFEVGIPSPITGGTGTINNVPNASGEYSQPTFQYQPGSHQAKVGTKRLDGTWAVQVLSFDVPFPPTIFEVNNLNKSMCAGASLPLEVDGMGDGPITFGWYPSISVDDPSAKLVQVSPLETTIYTATVTDVNGCTSSLEIEIDVDDPISITGLVDYVPSEDDLLSPTGVFIANATGGTPNYTFDWSPNDFLQVTSDPVQGLSTATMINTNSDTWEEANLGSAIVIVEVTDLKGCKAREKVAIHYTPSVNPKNSLAQNAQEEIWISPDASELVKFYPNPTTGLLNIQHEMGAVDLRVIDMQGKIVMDKHEEADNFHIDLANLPSGIYQIHLSNLDANVLFRIVKAGQ